MCGSLRRDSYNRQLLAAAKKIVVENGGEVEEIDFNEFVLPFYNQDIQDAGMPDIVTRLKTKVETADILMIVSPEYNYSIPAVIKNAIDWLSREKNSLSEKVAIICGASDGPYGTLRGQFQLRQVLMSLNVLIIPQPQLMLRFAEKAFNTDGSLVDQKTQATLAKLITKTMELARRLNT